MSRAEAMAAVQARRSQEAASMVFIRTGLCLSVADLDRITLTAAGYGQSVQDFLAKFITDAVCGTFADLKASYEAKRYLEEAYPDRHNPDYSLSFIRYLYDHGQLMAVMADPDIWPEDFDHWKWVQVWNDYLAACRAEHMPPESWDLARDHLIITGNRIKRFKQNGLLYEGESA